jgi:hypothetical protein
MGHWIRSELKICTDDYPFKIPRTNFVTLVLTFRKESNVVSLLLSQYVNSINKTMPLRPLNTFTRPLVDQLHNMTVFVSVSIPTLSRFNYS